MSLGVVVGKFYPPHRGHRHLIRVARSRVDRLVVLVCDHPGQLIPARLRADWLREVHPDCEVVLTPDDLPDEPELWGRRTIEILGRAPDWVFSSEDYGPGYAKAMGAQHLMVDRERVVVPVSGTKIRAKVVDYLDFVEPCVRAYLIPRVVVIGAESTGKTTLAKNLAEHFGTVWVPEFGREYCEASSRTLESELLWTTDEFVAIAREQQNRENMAARQANPVLIADTNATATGTWHERYLGFRSPKVDAIGTLDRVDLYLLLSPDVPFVQDGWRDGEKVRDWMHRSFLSSLPPEKTTVIEGPWESREPQAIAAIESLLRAGVDRF